MRAQIVSFHCILRDRFGHILSTSFNQDLINQLERPEKEGIHQNLRGLVAGLQDVSAGEKRNFTVPAAEAFGVYQPDLVLTVHRSELPESKQLGVGSWVRSKSGSNQAYRVVHIDGDQYTLDGNHPLAGQDLSFDIEVVAARDARREDFEETHLH